MLCLVALWLSLGWCGVNAITDLSESECIQNMRDDWFDEETYPEVTLSPEEQEYFDSCNVDDSEAEPRAGIPRLECRRLSDQQRRRLFSAIQELTNNSPGGGMSQYDIFASQHRRQNAPGAHFGPCFCSWHRQFLLNFERALQRIDPTVSLCYWDSSLDADLPDARHSCLWTPEFFGNGEGYVTSGPFANQLAGVGECRSRWGTLFRQFGGNSLLFTDDKIQRTVESCSSFRQLNSPYGDSPFENYHGGPHSFCGGHMSLISCSPTDPVFYFHHAFIDLLCHTCIRRLSNGPDYPNDADVPPNHRPDDDMLPFGRVPCRAGQGYIPDMYEYEERLGPCNNDRDCGSRYLWCNVNRCTTCVRSGGTLQRNWPNASCYIPDCRVTANNGGRCSCAS